MPENDELDQEEDGQKSYAGDSARLSIDSVESVDGVDAEDRSEHESYGEEPLGDNPYAAVDDDLLRSETSYPDS